MIGADEVMGRRDVTTHQGPVTGLGIAGVGSGPGPRLRREAPAPDPGTLTRRMLWCQVMLRGGQRQTEVRPSSSSTHHQRHHSRSWGDRRFLSSEKSGSSYVSRREVQLSPVVPQATEKRTITVILSPPRPARMDDPTGVTGPTDSAALADSAGVTGPTDSAEVHDSTGDESAGNHNSAADDEPEIVDDSAGVADPAQEQDPAGADSAQTQNSAVDDSARGDEPVAQGTPAGTTPDAVQDASTVSDVSSLLFPSLPRSINQANLLDFMSMMTLLQRRMDLGLPVPDTQSRPVDQTPMTRDQTHLEDPRLQLSMPGLQSDVPGLQSGIPEGWTSPEIPSVPGPPLEDLHLPNLLPGMLHQSIFPQLWTQKRK